MAEDLWINLPVKDVANAKAFFTAIGFTLNPHYGNSADSASFLVGTKGIVVMLFSNSQFEGFTQHALADTTRGTEVLFSLGAASKEAVDEMASRAAAAGGTVFSKPAAQGEWMYGCAFADLDGHRWNALFMDMSKLPQR